MDTSFRNQGKISQGLGGTGTVTEAMVTQRAKEIAIINGRNANDFNEEDRRQARQELLGMEYENLPETTEDTPLVGSSAWDANPGSRGRPAPKVSPRDEQSEAEKMVENGAEEAEHDTMLQGSNGPANEKTAD